MTRKLKNSVMIAILVLMGLSMFFTINYAKEQVNSTNNKPNTNDMRPLGDDNFRGELPEKMHGDFKDGPKEDFGSGKQFPMMDASHVEKDNGDIFNKLEINSYNKSRMYLLLGGESLIISVIIGYLIISGFNKKSIKEIFNNRDKVIIYVLSCIVLTGCLTYGTILITKNFNGRELDNLMDQSALKDKVNLNESNVIKTGNIDLSLYSTDVTITEGGTYTFNGVFKNSIIVNAKNQDVEIILNGVEVETENTAAIIGLDANTLTITLADGTENKLSDGGNSEYDGCIFSNAELIFEGNGKLIVNGNQNEGEGIATEAKNITINSGTIVITSNDDGINAGGDGATITINGGIVYVDASGDGIDSNKNAIINGGVLFVMGSDIGGDAGVDTDQGFTINGGFVVALGSDMIETPEDSSKQKTIAFTLNEKIDKDTLITLMRDNEVVVSFKATKSFKTIIISSDTLEDGNYTLYKGGSNSGVLEYGIYNGGEYTIGSKITINNIDTFSVSNKVNLYGSSIRN